ncbi:MAG: shikimate kinase [Dysgonamonadaceae bacterium]|jgi:shikimate kinase|nr:shikimate kinase [Dysgonamonadaceae bacterium]
MQKIFLIGYMGAGKTTIGKRLSQKLNLQFIDLDLFIESRYRKTINELFAEKGEEHFRDIERKALLEVSQFENVVISTGGGTPCFFDNASVMNGLGKTVYLKISPDELIRRLITGRRDRPLVKDKNKEEMERFIIETLAEREPFYNQAAIVFDATHLTSDLNHIVEELSLQLGNGSGNDR